ncbi:hypothetical protein B484DRAFT_455058 [Ochromonadaceae sp. CCMP2298]|nr:hypothetical protein B484DRAFT_455058 [Ochromonadaceae sp. CCMP2298]
MNFLRRSGPQMALARASKLAAGSAPCATRTYLAVPTSSFRTAQPPIQSSFRAFSSVTEDSWAAERLGVVGEKVAPGTGMPREVPEGLVNEPTAKTTKLAQDILELNMLEVNQLMRVIQVSSLHCIAGITCASPSQLPCRVTALRTSVSVYEEQ